MLIKEFGEYLKRIKKKAANTVAAYESDLHDFEAFVKDRDYRDLKDVTSTDIVAYMHNMKSGGKSSSTINRKLSSIRAFYNYLVSVEVISENPSEGIKSPKTEKKELEYLTLEEIDKLMESQDDSLKGLRDKAILEVLYATGIKASELISMNCGDVNFRMGFVTCDKDADHARIVPLGRPARAALEAYYYDVRVQLLRENESEEALFLNYQGGRISRQGLWKILKECGEKAGLKQKLNPNTLRNSFAIHMLQNGANLKALQELMGYEDISATQIYLTATKTRIKDVYDKAHPRA